ncbi:hypothetical protein AB0L40_09005 [Patulibacter sp. NPDC049589]|uniref:hypothetical protein n=1 Tax=Patulibacter sp. NPDC049589 TaxID=3154731 RepID=UPI003428C1CA
MTAVVCGLAALTGCGSSEQATSTTVVERVTVEAPAATTAAEPQTKKVAAAEEEVEATTTQKAAAAQPKKAKKAACTSRVPDVVGMENLQVSQDALQEAGYYLMRQKDATGQGRSQLWDRNWVVLRQRPVGGTCASLGTLITTYSKKIGE